MYGKKNGMFAVHARSQEKKEKKVFTGRDSAFSSLLRRVEDTQHRFEV